MRPGESITASILTLSGDQLDANLENAMTKVRNAMANFVAKHKQKKDSEASSKIDMDKKFVATKDDTRTEASIVSS